MDHILATGPEELSRTHDLIEQYKPSGFKEWLHSFRGKSFKRAFYEYAQKKEDILMRYTSLHSDIQKDVQKSHALPTEIQHIREDILSITQSIELCAQLLESMIEHAHGKQEMIHHEKVFFAGLLTSFNSDLLEWVGSHEKEVFGESTKLDSSQAHNPFEHGRKVLMIQKKKLESHLKKL